MFSKWSTLEDKFKYNFRDRELVQEGSFSTDNLPLYSSFSKDNVLLVPDLPGKKTDDNKDITKDITSQRSSLGCKF